jgi:hypothetical protein
MIQPLVEFAAGATEAPKRFQERCLLPVDLSQWNAKPSRGSSSGWPVKTAASMPRPCAIERYRPWEGSHTATFTSALSLRSGRLLAYLHSRRRQIPANDVLVLLGCSVRRDPARGEQCGSVRVAEVWRA